MTLDRSNVKLKQDFEDCLKRCICIELIQIKDFYENAAEGAAAQEVSPAFAALVHDRMTECVYETPIETFTSGVTPEAVFTVPVVSEGRLALEAINKEMALGFDDWDLDFYTELFQVGAFHPLNL